MVTTLAQSTQEAEQDEGKKLGSWALDGQLHDESIRELRGLCGFVFGERRGCSLGFRPFYR